MSRPRRSCALVIVNTDFRSGDGDAAFGARRGAKREAEKLSKRLSRLGYEVKLMHNQTAKEIEDLYQQGTQAPASPAPPRPPRPAPSPSPPLGLRTLRTPRADARRRRFGRLIAECRREHGEFFVSIISSHGEEGVVLGCDSEPVKLTRIFQILSSEKCPALTKIPKIFFIQVRQLLGDSLIPLSLNLRMRCR